MKKLLATFAAMAVLAFVVFEVFVYPAHDLNGFGKDQYEQAWEVAAKGFCASSGLGYLGRDSLKYRGVEGGRDAYGWGVARCSTPNGLTRLSWIYLIWSPKHQVWERATETVLADDDDRIYYTLTFPGQARCAWYATTKLLKEVPRQVREWLGAPLH